MTAGDFLKGKWLRHPLHAAIVHIPVGLWPAALLFDLLSFAGVGGNTMVRLSFIAIAAGLLVAAVAVPTGVADWSEIKQERPAWKIGLYHMGVNLVVIILYGINMGLRLENLSVAPRVAAAPLILSSIGTVLLFVSAYLGGMMVYDQGTGIARHSKHKWRKTAETAGGNVPPQK